MNYKESLVKPVLFMVFNRPEKTKRVWEQIRKARPQKLYVSADGARAHLYEDKEKCEQVRKIVSNVDWDCEVKYLFHENNLGCSFAGKTAFDWVFSNEDEIIELEDDTLPSNSFFWFCQEVLEKYKFNENVGYITGQNFMGIENGNASYFFSRYGGSSGWATWKRVYLQWDYKLSDLKNVLYSKNFKSKFDSSFEYKFWSRKFEHYYNFGGNTYDLQSVFSVFKNNFINIIPNKNLITNIGFDLEGSNYNGGDEKFANKPNFEFKNIIHPDEIKRNPVIDQKIFNYHFLSRSRVSLELRWTLAPYYRKLFLKGKK